MLERLLHIRPDERQKVLLLFLYSFGTAAAYVISRAVADGIFLSHVGPQYLPGMYAASAVAVIVVSFVYSYFARHQRLERVIGFSLLLLAGVTCLMPTVLSRLGDSLVIVALLYLLAEIRGALGTIQFTSLINEAFPAGDAKRVYGVIGSGATLAGILFGGLVGLEAYELGAANLLYVAAALEVAVLISLARFGGQLHHVDVAPVAQDKPTTDPASPPGMLRTVVSSPPVRMLALLVLIRVVVAFVIEFEWKVAATHAFEATDEAESAMTRFFGLYYAAVYLLTGLLQLLVIGRLLKHLDVIVSLLVFPGSLLLGTVAVIASPGPTVQLLPTTLLKGCDVFKRSIQSPAEQLLFSGIVPQMQRQAVAFVNGVVKPVAEISSGLLILPMYLLLPEETLGYAVLTLLAAWILISWRCRKLYLAREAAGEEALVVPDETAM